MREHPHVVAGGLGFGLRPANGSRGRSRRPSGRWPSRRTNWNCSTFCGTPSSVTSKSAACRSATRLVARPVTVTSTRTSLTPPRKTGGCCCACGWLSLAPAGVLLRRLLRPAATAGRAAARQARRRTGNALRRARRSARGRDSLPTRRSDLLPAAFAAAGRYTPSMSLDAHLVGDGLRARRPVDLRGARAPAIRRQDAADLAADHVRERLAVRGPRLQRPARHGGARGGVRPRPRPRWHAWSPDRHPHRVQHAVDHLRAHGVRRAPAGPGRRHHRRGREPVRRGADRRAVGRRSSCSARGRRSSRGVHADRARRAPASIRTASSAVPCHGLAGAIERDPDERRGRRAHRRVRGARCATPIRRACRCYAGLCCTHYGYVADRIARRSAPRLGRPVQALDPNVAHGRGCARGLRGMAGPEARACRCRLAARPATCRSRSSRRCARRAHAPRHRAASSRRSRPPPRRRCYPIRTCRTCSEARVDRRAPARGRGLAQDGASAAGLTTGLLYGLSRMKVLLLTGPGRRRPGLGRSERHASRWPRRATPSGHPARDRVRRDRGGVPRAPSTPAASTSSGARSTTSRPTRSSSAAARTACGWPTCSTARASPTSARTARR